MGADRQPCGDCDQRGEEVWQVLDPELVQDQDAQEAGHEGGEAHDVRQRGRREGKAGENDCEGLRRSKGEAERLMLAKRGSVASCCLHMPARRGASSRGVGERRYTCKRRCSVSTLAVFAHLVESHLYVGSAGTCTC